MQEDTTTSGSRTQNAPKRPPKPCAAARGGCALHTIQTLTAAENLAAKKRMHEDTTTSGSCTQNDPNARLRIMALFLPSVSAETEKSPPPGATALARTEACVRGGWERACGVGPARCVRAPSGGPRRAAAGAAAGARGTRSGDWFDHESVFVRC